MKILKVCQECGKTNNETKMYRFEDGYLCNRHYQQIKNNGEIKHTRYDSNIIAVNGDLAEIELYNYYGEFKGVAIMDSDDVNKISKFKWHLSNNGYVGTDFKGERILLHRLLINPSIEDVVDHINGNPLDNRKCNLRICKQKENVLNSKLRNDNKSGIKGINYNHKEQKWRAYITHNNKTKHLGWFNTKEEAAKARIEAETTLFGEYSSRHRSQCNG